MFDDHNPDDSTGAPSPGEPSGAGEETAPAVSSAVERFRSCRWYRPAEDSQPECCSHRDVLPLAGVNGFDPEAWCPDCEFYKVRRTPRKHPQY